jgi:hypothetical protein
MQTNILLPKKIAVIEFSSTSCKLIIGDVRGLVEGFCWGRPVFHNKSTLTNVWFDLHVRKLSPATILSNKLLRVITEFKKEIKDNMVDHFVCVSTSGYRNGHQEILLRELVENEIGCSIYPLSNSEETSATISAYLWSKTRGGSSCLFIDQGGGSTELSVLDANGETVDSKMIPRGTLSVMKSLLDSEEALEDALNQVPNYDFSYPISHDLEVVASGSAITRCLDMRSNQFQHERVLAKSLLEQRVAQLKRKLLADFSSIRELKQAMCKQNKSAFQIQNDLKSVLGLQMMLSVLNKIGREYIRVNGAGLRYGIFLQQLLNFYPEFFLNPAKYQIIWNDVQLQEGEVVTGVVSKINRFGVFVQFDQYEGLVHYRKLKKKGIFHPQKYFTSKDSLRVRITSVMDGSKGTKINLSLWDLHGERL